jgi:putative membrane protein
MFYTGYHFFGMHIIWWLVWLIVFLWIFATPYYVPGQQKKKNSALDILQKRFASGEIQLEEYEEKRKMLSNE